ncbi:hypothetical protein Osc1_00650 [Hominimerdicola sp. 21CYCFAH17_S]
MSKINDLMIRAYLKANRKVNDIISDERGEVNMIAIILIIIVVIGLVAVFRSSIEEVIDLLINKIKDAIKAMD